MEKVGLFSAFLAGVLTFISPCILPLIPGYLGFITGSSLADLKQKQQRSKIMIYSSMFVLGFSLIFILLGASATLLGKIILTNQKLLNKIAGILIMLFGLHLTGVLKIGLLNFEGRFQLKNIKPSPGLAFVFGIAFALGWSPCIGPILASILVIAGNQDTVGQGILLLTVYSAGLAIPFLLSAVALDRFFSFFNRIKKYFRAIELGSGILLVILGYFIFTNQLVRFTFLIGK